MAELTKQHFVPDMLSKRFADESDQFYILIKSQPGCEVKSVSYKKQFQKNNFYTLQEIGKSKDLSLERNFGKLESKTSPILSKIIELARNGCRPKLKQSEREVLERFVYNQFKRVPDYHNLKLEAVIEPYKSNVENIEKFRKNVRAKALSYDGTEVLTRLSQLGLVVFKAQRSRDSFILGSHPVLLGADFENCYGLSCVLFLPITHDVAIAFNRSVRKTKLIQFPNDKEIKLFNRKIYEQSAVVASRSPNVLYALNNS